MAEPGFVKLSECNAMWCVDDRTPSEVERYLKDNPRTFDGLDVELYEGFDQSTVRRSHACILMARLAYEGFTVSEIPCRGCFYGIQIAMDQQQLVKSHED